MRDAYFKKKTTKDIDQTDIPQLLKIESWNDLISALLNCSQEKIDIKEVIDPNDITNYYQEIWHTNNWIKKEIWGLEEKHQSRKNKLQNLKEKLNHLKYQK